MVLVGVGKQKNGAIKFALVEEREWKISTDI